MASLSSKIMSQILMAKKSKGRQKIEMTRMSKESNLLVTFSKRRSGLFKKASELCTLCGAEIAIVVFSPGKKAFSFGHPSVEAIADRFIFKSSLHGASSSSATTQLVEAHRNASVRELNAQLTEATNQLELEKKRGDELNKILKKPNQERCWWEAPIEELSMEQLEQLKIAMEELKKNVTKQAEKFRMVEPSNPHYANPSATSFFGQSPLGPSTSYNGTPGQMADIKVPGLGLSMTPHGPPPGFSFGYGYGQAQGNSRGFF